MKWLRSRTAVVAVVMAVAALTFALGAWQGWLAQAAGTTYIVNDVAPPEAGCGTPNFTDTNLNNVIAASQVHDGDTLVLCEGTYAGGVTVNKKVTIKGQDGVDRDKIIIQVAAAGTDGMTVGADDVTISHLKLDGPAAADKGITVTGRNATISDVEVTDWDIGILASSAIDTVVQDSNIHGNGTDGIQLDHASGSRIIHNSIVDNLGNQISINTADLTIVQDNTMSGSATTKYQVYIKGRSHIQVLRNAIATRVTGAASNGGIEMDVLPAEALVIIGGSDANANTFDGDLATGAGIQYYIKLACGSEDTVNATHNYWKGPPAISSGVTGVIFNDEDDPGTDCPGDSKGAVVFHPVAPGPAPAPPPPPPRPPHYALLVRRFDKWYLKDDETVREVEPVNFKGEFYQAWYRP